MKTRPSSRSDAALSMAAWMAALSSVRPSPAAPVSVMARGSSSRVVKAEVPDCAQAAAPPATSKTRERSSFFMGDPRVALTSLADQELDVLPGAFDAPHFGEPFANLILQRKIRVMLRIGLSNLS